MPSAREVKAERAWRELMWQLKEEKEKEKAAREAQSGACTQTVPWTVTYAPKG